MFVMKKRVGKMRFQMEKAYKRFVPEHPPSLRIIHACDIPLIASQGYYYHTTQNRPLQIKPHAHDFYELIFVLKGECTHEINGLPYAAGQSSLFVLRPGDIHRFTSQSDDADLLALSIAEEEYDSFVYAYGAQAVSIIMDSDTIPVMQLSSMQRCEWIANCDRFTTFDTDTRLSVLRIMAGRSVQYFLSRTITPSTGTFPPKFLHAVEQMSQPGNLREGMKAFLRLSNYSHPQLCRIMKRYGGITPQDFILQLRMNYALELLINTDYNLHIISEEVGYSSLSHFTKVFHQYFDVTPSSVRK